MMGNAHSPTSHSSDDDEEMCPSCGKWYPLSAINTYTGFCEECSQSILNSASGSIANTANISKLESFLNDNADHIEHYISAGHTVSSAISRVYDANRPRCACCGVFITRAKKSAIFCRDNPRCRRASRRYVYLYRERGHTKPDALAIVLSELTGE